MTNTHPFTSNDVLQNHCQNTRFEVEVYFGSATCEKNFLYHIIWEGKAALLISAMSYVPKNIFALKFGNVSPHDHLE